MNFNEKAREVVKQLRPIDDTFFKVLAEHKEFIEEMLQVLKQDKKLKVIELYLQKEIHNLYGKTIILDVLVVDQYGNLINIEIQKSDTIDHVQRAFYNLALMQMHGSKKGDDTFEEIPRVECIYICNFDVFGKDELVYHIINKILETNEIIDTNRSVMFVNCSKVDNSTEIGRYVQLLKQSYIDDVEFPNIKKYVNMNKKEGDVPMCKLVEDFAKEYSVMNSIASVLKMIKKKYDISEISDVLGLSTDTISKIKELNSTDVEYIYTQLYGQK